MGEKGYPVRRLWCPKGGWYRAIHGPRADCKSCSNSDEKKKRKEKKKGEKKKNNKKGVSEGRALHEVKNHNECKVKTVWHNQQSYSKQKLHMRIYASAADFFR